MLSTDTNIGNATPSQPQSQAQTNTVSPVCAINMLRSTQQHHIMLSSMADQKASFLVGAAIVTLTLVLGQWNKDGFMLPMVCLGLGCLVSATFAALALIPRHSKTHDQLSFNPLFFGHFTEMTEEAYIKTISRVIETDITVYEAMAKDIHQMGSVLRRKKFLYLGWGYRTFVITLVATLITSIFEMI